jgi:methylated-DNA-[protein]-cysteine S-methyltransferase
MSFPSLVFSACKKIPKGKVATYSEIAKAIGHPNAARAVGNALSKNRSKSVPCHRVIRSDGSAGGFARGMRAKIRILKREGVEITNGKVPKRFLFDFSKFISAKPAGSGVL